MASLVDSAGSGDRLVTLRALRDWLARALDECVSLRDGAALAGRLQSVLEEIAKVEGPKEVGDGIDEIAERRSARRSGTAKGSVRAGVQS